MEKLQPDGWQRVGEIGVDAGLCWIGDPCYILHKNQEKNDPLPEAIGKNWGEFCNKLDGVFDRRGAAQFNYDLGHPGLGVCTSTGWGDGSYDVYIRRGEQGRVAAVLVDFMGVLEEGGDLAD